MMNKYFVLIGIVLLLCPFLFSDSISSYNISNNVPLNQGVTATGVYTGDINSGVLCSFYFFNSDGFPITRATDQYTDSSGRFFMPAFPITEPTFQRGYDFNIITTCGTATANSSFSVVQKQEFINGLPIYPQGFVMDLHYWTDEENSMMFIWMIFAILVILFLLSMFLKGYKSRN